MPQRKWMALVFSTNGMSIATITGSAFSPLA